MAAPRHERQWGAASEFINGKISAEDFQQRVQQLITACSDNNSTCGASSGIDQQHPKIATNSNIPVNPTEAVNMSGRRPSHFFGEKEANGASPLLNKDKADKLARVEVGSNPSSPITEPSIIGSSPSRPASVPGHHNQWPGSASITGGVSNSPQPTEQVFGGATTVVCQSWRGKRES